MPPPPGERIRTLRACTACSSRKVKCDGQEQCSACKKHNVQCVYVDSGKKRGPPKGAPARGGPKKRVLAESTTPSSSKGFSDTSDSKPVANDLGEGMRLPSFVDRRPQHSVRVVSPVVSPSNAPGGYSHGGSASPISTFDSLLGLDADPIRDREERPLHSGNMSEGYQPFHHSHNLLSQETGRSASISLPSQTSSAAPPPPAAPLPAQTGSGSPSIVGQTGLSEDAIDELLLLYETFIHVHWPIIYLPALRSLRALERQSPIVFDAVLALSCANQDLGHNLLNSDSSGTQYARGPYAAISEMLVESVRQRVLSSLGTCDLPTVQACILITLVDIGYGRMQYAYHMGGIACRMAIDLGLHTMRTAGLHNVTPSRREHERYRTLWACFILDKILAALLQRPPMMRSVMIDTPRPSTMERDELDLWLAGRASQYLNPAAVSIMECSKSYTLSSFNTWIDVMAILEEILEHVYRPSECRARIESPETAGQHYDELVVGIDGALRAWRRNLPPHLQWNDGDERAHRGVGPHVLTVRGWFYTCMILVHRPRVPFLDAAASPHNDAAEALSRMSHNATSSPNTPAHKRLPKGIDASRDAASNICQVLEGYKHSFRVRKFPSVWVYMIFQAGTVHGGLAARSSPSPFVEAHGLGISPQREESFQRLEQCIGWLDQIGNTWSSASHHSAILRRISAVGAKTRPPSPRYDVANAGGTAHNNANSNVFDIAVVPGPGSASATSASAPAQPDNLAQQNEDLINSWILFWAGMPTASDDLSLWQGFESLFTDNPQINPQML